MKMFHRPRQLWFLAIMAWVSLPLLALNISVFEKTPVWKIFHPETFRLLGLQALWVAVTMYWMLRARWASFWSFGIFSGVTLYANLYFLIHSKNYGLAFYALAFLIFSIFFASHLYQVLDQVYFDSGKEWFEGLPRFIPHMEVSITAAGKNIPGRICRIDQAGCFVFGAEVIKLPERIIISLNGQSVECGVKLISKTIDGLGLGMMFRVENQDQWKDLCDFIHRVRSFGYV